MFLSSNPPLIHLMAYNSTASYMFAMVTFGAALLSVTSGVAVHVMYETSITHRDMDALKVSLFVWDSVIWHISSTCHDGKYFACYVGWHAHRSVWPLLPALCLCVSEVSSMMRILVTHDVRTAIFIACFSVRKLFVTVITAACCATFILNGVLTLYVFLFVIRT
jgi:hypothetical protein